MRIDRNTNLGDMPMIVESLRSELEEAQDLLAKIKGKVKSLETRLAQAESLNGAWQLICAETQKRDIKQAERLARKND